MAGLVYTDCKRFEELAKSYGWKLERTVGEYCCFIYTKDHDVMPFICKVSNGKVSIEYVQRFKYFAEEIEGKRQDPKSPI